MNGAVQPSTSNFGFLAEHGPALVTLGAQAERYFADDPAACLGKLRVLSEILAQEVAAHCGLYTDANENQLDLLRRLRERGVLPREIEELFHGVRRSGNAAVHRNAGSESEALHQLKMVRQLAVWFHRTFGKDRAFRPGPFVPPRPPIDATAELIAELTRLRESLSAAEQARLAAEETARSAETARLSAEARAQAEAADREAAEALLDEAAERIASIQQDAQATSAATVQAVFVRAADAASELELDEADTRALIDAQLRAAGWEADSKALRWSADVRPQKGRNLAIAEWPTDDGRADYVLFVGLTPIAVVEAKRKAKDVAGSLEQSKRYARAFREMPGVTLGGSWGDYRVPFLFATNGRPYLKQLETKSGIWFLDARRAKNLSVPLDGWYTPDGLASLLKQDHDDATDKLKQEPTDYLGLRDYQIRAIRAAEDAIAKGQREVLLAMATGTGKTKTCIGLCYRLLKTKRFRRILFLVDRSALGEQTANAFKETRLEALQTFDSIFDLKTLEDVRPDSDTKLHIATIQGMVKRILYSEEGVPTVDQYDCIVVDECHRGYLLDREMSDGEVVFRNQEDYVSKYRRVLEHFDAVKVGLTATPALHTREIFGPPVFTYSYREAVIDGFLVDHEPPTRIVTKLAQDGITWQVGEQVETYEPRTGEVQLALLPDEVHVEVEEFNRRVVTENFNRVVCEQLAKHIDPTFPAKTLVFCATDDHADLVVRLLKEAFAAAYDGVEDNAVVKITGASDKPLELIRRYKNEKLPNVAVTVDLLTTGVDVPAISNLVFLRRVRSRILYEQMLGRATRLCPDIGKEVFHIYDAVDLYGALAPYSDMKPVVTNVSLTFGQLVEELTRVEHPDHRGEVFDQLLAKLRRKARTFPDDLLDLFETASGGMKPSELVDFLKKNGADVARAWFIEHARVAEILDASVGGPGSRIFISHHDDVVVEVGRGYGPNRERPGDFLEGFERYVRQNMNNIPALLLVAQRPRDLTRQQLKELRLVLDQAGYTEVALQSAWRDKTNEDIAASIIGHIRRAALGDALVPYDERVRGAMKKILASRAWDAPQRKWLERIGKQLEKEIVVDHEAIDRGQFQAEGGFKRLNKIFEGKLEALLGEIADEVWKVGA
ncbi:MAG: type I restriction-modification system endonuclease [Polyangiales bacterium]